jgi:hypothetical protein
MFLMNEESLGGCSPTKNNVLGSYTVGSCWCGESYFGDPTDGVGRVVSSGDRLVEIWKVQTSPKVKLTRTTSAQVTTSGQDPGFFTTISSNGTANSIIWALSRPPKSKAAPISLFAFNPESSGGNMKTLFKKTAGNWPNLTGDANLVPVVANGQVFVASNKQLQIFGLIGKTKKK